MAAGDATWRTGTLTVPSSTTTVSVTGLGGTPKALIFFGTNFLTEDASVTSSGTGIFRGMAAPHYSSPSTIVQTAGSIVPAGDAQYFLGGNAIGMLDSPTTLSLLYLASVSSFDADGFTVSWGAVTAGGYKVVWVALMDVVDVGAFRGITNQSGLAFGFKAGASLIQGVWGAGDGGGNAANNDRTQNWYGGAAYPGTSASDWMSAGMSAFCTQGSGSTILEMRLDAPNVRVVTGGHGGIGGTFTPDDIFAAPTGGGGLTSLSFGGAGGGDPDSGMIMAWDDEDSATGIASIPANTGNTTTVSGLPFEPGLVVFYSISDEPDGYFNYGAGLGRGANGFGVATPDFQWSALVDGVSSRGAFQSFQRGFTDCVNGSNVHAGTVELTADGFVLTTAEDDVSGGSLIWHAFGHPSRRTLWIPHIYRLLMIRGGISGIPAVTGALLLEDGDKIELEEGGGVLLL